MGVLEAVDVGFEADLRDCFDLERLVARVTLQSIGLVTGRRLFVTEVCNIPS